jgi:membrane protein required for colicin V production
MQPLDILLCIPLGYALWKGWQRGILVEAMNTLGLVIAIVAGFMLLDVCNNLLAKLLGHHRFLFVVTFILIVVAVMAVVIRLSKLTSAMVRETVLGQLDQVFGAALSLFKMTLTISFLVWILGVLDIRIPKRHTQDTFIYPALAQSGPLAAKVVYVVLPFLARIPAWLEEALRPQPVPKEDATIRAYGGQAVQVLRPLRA